MSDIVERLREGCGCNFPETTCMAESECADAFEAADTITALRAEVEKLRAALKQIDIGFVRAKDAPAMHDEAIRIARAALEEKQ